MNSLRLRLSVRAVAKSAIADQYDYYVMRQDLRLAERWEATVLRSLESLTTMTERGTLCGFSEERLQGLRRLATPVFPFVIYYLLDEAAGVVRVIHILHVKRQAEDLLAKTLQQQGLR